MIPYGRQSIDSNDIDAVIYALKSDWLTQGPAVPAFEKKLTEICQVSHGVAFNSATSALYCAYAAVGVGPGKRLWTSPITFVATSNMALALGAEVEFVDVDLNTFNICPEAMNEKLESAKSEGMLPDVVVPVHMAGRSCDMKSIWELSREFGFRVVEDASHAIGGMYEGEPVGCCRYSDIVVFSFHPVKIITTGEGGAALTNDPDLALSMRRTRAHGITKNSEEMCDASHGEWYYQQIAMGFNFRMTDIQAALGMAQLSKLSGFISRRRKIAIHYRQSLNSLPIVLPPEDDSSISSWHLFIIGMDMPDPTAIRKKLFDYLRENQILVQVHYIPVHTQPYYINLGFHDGQFPRAMKYYQRSLSLPIYPDLQQNEQEKVINHLNAFFKCQ